MEEKSKGSIKEEASDASIKFQVSIDSKLLPAILGLAEALVDLFGKKADEGKSEGETMSAKESKKSEEEDE